MRTTQSQACQETGFLSRAADKLGLTGKELSMTTDLATAIPDGFELLPDTMGYIGHNGPYHVKALGGGTYRYGF